MIRAQRIALALLWAFRATAAAAEPPVATPLVIEDPDAVTHFDELRIGATGAEQPALESRRAEPSDLTLRNLFSEGWRQPYRGRPRAGRAPRFHQFTTKQPFLDREARLNYFFQENFVDEGSGEHELQFELEIPFNRRVLIDAEPFYVWEDKKNGERDDHGPGIAIATYLQLIDTRDTALNVQFKVERFSQSLGVDLSEAGISLDQENSDTALSFVVAGFRDLTPWGAKRVGLSYHFEHATFAGPNPEEVAKNFITVGATVAKTLIEPDVPVLGDFTVFVEALAVSALDGESAGRIGLAFLPGLRTNLGTETSPWFVVAGIQVPVTGPKPFDYTVALSLIHWFE